MKAMEEMKDASPPKRKPKAKLRDTAPVRVKAFQISREEFIALPPDEIEKISMDIWKENGKWIDEQFAARQAKWLLVVGGRIVASYPDDESCPSEEALRQIERCEGRIAWMLGHEDEEMIEEGVAWSAISVRDAYPTLPVGVAHKDWGMEEIRQRALFYNADFDTGSPFVLLNYKELVAQNIAPMQPLSNMLRKSHLGRSYVTCRLPVALWVEDERGKKHRLEYPCDCVLNWERSPFCLVNPQRQALVGRPSLLEFPLTVELDGAQKQTKVKRVGRRRKKK
ncbi:MAG: hypothetical protein NZT92_04140 [Abditibacteriales bacterium]|nr:hypothetical protein [Abditibacteriales bacterium]MDW8365123.1 hypothetical protein [Abditibacteriales bacterium]